MVWIFQNGTLLTPPQGSDFLRFDSLKVLPLLFSSWHGLFSTHPVLLVGLVGLLWSIRRRQPLGVAFLLAFVPMTVLNSAVDDWWAGSSFGMRRYDSLLPFFFPGRKGQPACPQGDWSWPDREMPFENPVAAS